MDTATTPNLMATDTAVSLASFCAVSLPMPAVESHRSVIRLCSCSVSHMSKDHAYTQKSHEQLHSQAVNGEADAGSVE